MTFVYNMRAATRKQSIALFCHGDGRSAQIHHPLTQTGQEVQLCGCGAREAQGDGHTFSSVLCVICEALKKSLI